MHGEISLGIRILSGESFLRDDVTASALRGGVVSHRFAFIPDPARPASVHLAG
jgi:hypothetical protein